MKAAELLQVQMVNTGPESEFQFWKRQMTRINSLVEELNRQDIKKVITVLEQANSNIIPVSYKRQNWILIL